MLVLTAVATFSDGLCLEPALLAPLTNGIWSLCCLAMWRDVSQTRPTAQGHVTDRWRFQWIGMRWIFLPSNPLSVLLIESTRSCHLQTKTAKLRKTCHSSSSISMPSYSGNLDTTETTNSVLRFTLERDIQIWEWWILRKQIWIANAIYSSIS